MYRIYHICNQIYNKRLDCPLLNPFQLLATKTVAAAAIAGHDGNIWAKSAGFNCSPDEVNQLLIIIVKTKIMLVNIYSPDKVKKVLGSWDNASAMGMSGVTLNGLRFDFVRFKTRASNASSPKPIIDDT